MEATPTTLTIIIVIAIITRYIYLVDVSVWCFLFILIFNKVTSIKLVGTMALVMDVQLDVKTPFLAGRLFQGKPSWSSEGNHVLILCISVHIVNNKEVNKLCVTLLKMVPQVCNYPPRKSFHYCLYQSKFERQSNRFFYRDRETPKATNAASLICRNSSDIRW